MSNIYIIYEEKFKDDKCNVRDIEIIWKPLAVVINDISSESLTILSALVVVDFDVNEYVDKEVYVVAFRYSFEDNLGCIKGETTIVGVLTIEGDAYNIKKYLEEGGWKEEYGIADKKFERVELHKFILKNNYDG